MTEELKKCPKCNHPNIDEDWNMVTQFSGYDEQDCSFTCTACKLEFSVECDDRKGPMREQAIAAWNTRADDWQDISTVPDKIKDEGIPILVYVHGYGRYDDTWQTVAYFNNIDEKWLSGMNQVNPTHWKPLDPPPKDTQ